MQGSLFSVAGFPSIRARGEDSFRMSAVPAFDPRAYAAEFTRSGRGRPAAAELLIFAARDAGGAAAARPKLAGTYRFSVAPGEYEAMTARIDALLAGWTSARLPVFCVDGTETEFERRIGAHIVSLASPCGSGAPDRAISAEVLRVLHRHLPDAALPTAPDWYGASGARPVRRAS